MMTSFTCKLQESLKAEECMDSLAPKLGSLAVFSTVDRQYVMVVTRVPDIYALRA